jgi:hypothetical protein
MPEPITATPPAAAPVQAPAPAKPPVPAAQAAPAAVPPAVPATPPVTPPPAAKPAGAAPAPAEGATVPITALHEEREKRQQLQAQLESMKKIMSSGVLFDVNGNPVMQQQPQQQAAPQYQEIEKLWETDPRKAVQAEIYAAMSWRDQVDAGVEQQALAVSEKNPDFNNFRPEVMTYLRTLPIEQRNKPGMIEAAYYFIKGQKVDNIVARTRQEWEAEYLRKLQAGELATMLPAGATGVPPTPQGAVTLTQDQKNAAAAMRIPEAEYAKWIQNKG